MRPKLFLRIAAVVMLLHTIGHTLGVLTSGQAPNPKVAAVIAGMRTEHFNFMGRSATLAQFYTGYGFILIFVLLLITAELWLLSSAPTKAISVSLGIFLVALSVLEYIYFFPFAASFSLISGILTLFAARTRMMPSDLERGSARSFQ